MPFSKLGLEGKVFVLSFIRHGFIPTGLAKKSQGQRSYTRPTGSGLTWYMMNNMLSASNDL